MSQTSRLQTSRWSLGAPPVSPTDPELLARAVKAHKAGDALAQMVIAATLVLAICAVMMVLGTERAAAASSLLRGGADGIGGGWIVLLGVGFFGVLAWQMMRPRAQAVPVKADRSGRRE